jgi:hypothetical protein
MLIGFGDLGHVEIWLLTHSPLVSYRSVLLSHAERVEMFKYPGLSSDLIIRGLLVLAGTQECSHRMKAETSGFFCTHIQGQCDGHGTGNVTYCVEHQGMSRMLELPVET